MSGSESLTRAQGFAPVCGPRTRLLILGSLPGGASLAAGRYYANPRNGFWVLLGGALGQALTGLSYEDRLAVLATHGVGLWDVVASAQRRGSLDAAIRDPEHADLAGLIARSPDLEAVAFNGALAARLGRRILSQPGVIRPDIALIDLPSSSPAHARPLAEKAARWKALSVFAGPASSNSSESS